jgi:hypothetical protein
MVGLVTVGVLGWIATAGASLASAATTSRLSAHTIGAARVQLANHLTSVSTGASEQAVNGADIMAGIVGALAFLALAFVIMTFVRRRVVVA